MEPNPTKPDGLVSLTAGVTFSELVAKAGEPAKRPTFSINAYTGSVMNVGGFYNPVVIDLAGLKAARAKLPILLDHDSSQIVGQGEATIDAAGLRISGTVTGEDGPSAKVVSHAKGGFEWQASIGATITRREFLEAGKKAIVNGREVSGPLLIAREAVAQEVSFVAIGADGAASATVAANSQGLNTMALDTTNETKDDIIAGERKRIAAIDSLCKDNWGDRSAHVEALRVKAINGELTTEQLQAELLVVLRASRGTGPAIHATTYAGHDSPTADVLSAAILRRVNEQFAVNAYGERAVEAAKRLNAASLADVVDITLRAGGVNIHGMSRSERVNMALKASGQSTFSLPGILSNTANKSLLGFIRDIPSNWRMVCDIVSARDFKAHSAYRPSMMTAVEKLAPGGEIKHTTMEEDQFDFRVYTWAQMFSVDRTTIINDDLGALNETQRLMAQALVRKQDDDFIDLLLSNAGNFFHADNGNYFEGASTNFQSSSLGTARQMLRTMKDAKGNNLGYEPAAVMVTATGEQNAKATLESEFISQTAAGLPTGNPNRSSLKLAVEPRLENATKWPTSYSTVAWYLFGPPSARAFVAAFLDGNQNPVTEFFGLDHQPNKLQVTFRNYADWGFAQGDPKAAVKSKGSA